MFPTTLVQHKNKIGNQCPGNLESPEKLDCKILWGLTDWYDPIE